MQSNYDSAFSSRGLISTSSEGSSQTHIRYSRLHNMSDDNDDNDDDDTSHSKQRLGRHASRRIRHIGTMKLLGADGILWWCISHAWREWLVYIFLAIISMFMKPKGFHPGEDTNYSSGVLEFLAAFLACTALTDAAARFDKALTSLLVLKNSAEGFRSNVLASTGDPKFKVAIDVFMSLLMVLLQKNICFFTEDFETQDISNLLNASSRTCVLFRPEVVWSLEISDVQYLIQNFLDECFFWDRQGLLKDKFDCMFSSWNHIAVLLQTPVPRTRRVLTKFVTYMFLAIIPFFDKSCLTHAIMPVVAMLLCVVLRLSAELDDPWSGHKHGVPIHDIMQFIASPKWRGTDVEVSIEWLNRGLMNGQWEFVDDNDRSSIPRKKHKQPNKGELIDFSGMRTLAEVMGFELYEDFAMYQCQDMDGATSRNRKMPVFLRKELS